MSEIAKANADLIERLWANEAARALEAQAAEIGRLRAALMPFANAPISPNVWDDYHVYAGLTVAHYRAAHFAIYGLGIAQPSQTWPLTKDTPNG